MEERGDMVLDSPDLVMIGWCLSAITAARWSLNFLTDGLRASAVCCITRAREI